MDREAESVTRQDRRVTGEDIRIGSEDQEREVIHLDSKPDHIILDRCAPVGQPNKTEFAHVRGIFHQAFTIALKTGLPSIMSAATDYS